MTWKSKSNGVRIRFMTKKRRRSTQSFGRWSPLMERVSGVIIIGVGLYFLWIV
mgnify:CR=1 FL=1